MRFGIITPVFDGCLESLELLYKDFELQTHKDWVWLLCSNKFSEKLSRFADSKGKTKNRIIYLNTNYEDEKGPFNTIANIGQRRDFCLRQIDADYIFMIDADAKILDKNMFQLINSELDQNARSICIYRIIHEEFGLLPLFPIMYGRIDLLNFCVKASLARKVGYPTTVNLQMPANDFWFFSRVFESCNGDFVFLDRTFCEHNGNNRYRNAARLLNDERKKNSRTQLRDYTFYCLSRNHPWGLLNVIKEVFILAKVFPRRVLLENKSYV